MVHLVCPRYGLRSSELTIWNEFKQGMINQYLMLNKVCFVAKTKIDDME